MTDQQTQIFKLNALLKDSRKLLQEVLRQETKIGFQVQELEE